MRQVISFNNKNWSLPTPTHIYTLYDYLYVPLNSRASWNSRLNTSGNNIEVEFETKLLSNDAGVCEIYGSSFTAAGQLCFAITSSSIFKFHSGHGSDPDISVSNIINRWIKYKQTTSEVYIDDVSRINYSYLGSYNSGNLMFFYIDDMYSLDSYKFKDAMIKDIKIKQGGTLVYDLKPASDNINNKKGFLNLVNNTFEEVTEVVGNIILGNE